MINIGTTDFIIAVKSLPRDEFELYSTNLFDAWDNCVQQSLMLPDYSISLEIEEGSIKGGGKIAVALGALYLGIGNYGGFMSGLQTIRDQVSYTGKILVENATSPLDGKDIQTTFRNRGGAVSRLHKLFQKVQQGKITADEAMVEAEKLLGKEAESSPEFMKDLQAQLTNAPMYPEQLDLIEESPDEGIGLLNDNPKRPSRTPRPKPDIPTNQYRVEIWRESRKGKKRVKVTKL